MLKERIIFYLPLIPFFWLVSGMILLPKGDSYMGGICVLSFFAIIFFDGKSNFINNMKASKFLWICLALLLYAIFSYFYHGYSSRELKAFFAVFIFLVVFPARRYDEKILIMLTGLGSISVVCMLFYQYLVLDYSRVGGHINSNVIATYAGLLCVLCALLSLTNKVYRYKFFCLMLLLLMAVSFTQTRGVILSIVVIFTIIVAIYIFLYYKKEKNKIIFVSVFMLIFFTLLFKSVLQERYETVLKEMELITTGNYDSSMGLRIQLWKASSESIGKKPIFGLGNAYKKEFNEYSDKELISPQLMRLTDVQSHYHNQFIDKLVKNGLVGLSLLLLLILYPFMVGLKKDVEIFYKLSLMGLPAYLVIAGLTEVPLNHTYIIYTYSFFIFLLLSFKNRVPKNYAV